jgi:DNA-binding CsgD family transcriptional regulator
MMPPQSASSRQPSITSGPDIRKTPTPFVGRDRETAALLHGLSSAARGEGALILLAGEAGIGKTRLCAEATALARQRGFFAIAGNCYATQGTPPYVPFVEAIEYVARVVPRDELRQTLGDAASDIARLVPDLRRLFPDLPPPAELPPEQGQRHLFNSLHDFVERSARVRPLLLVLEDLQWADVSTLLLLQHVAQRVAEVPALVLGTYREVELAPTAPLARCLQELLRQRLAREYVLRPLEEADVAAILTALGGSQPPPRLLFWLYGETDGNPFFLEEVVRHLREEGRLLDAEGHWRPDVSAGHPEVPRGVRLVIEHRLQRVSQTCQSLLAAAAVVGRTFDFALLEDISDVAKDADDRADSALLDAIDEAEKAYLIRGVPRLTAAAQEARAEVRYIFVHELTRQTILAGLSQPRQQRLHLRVAEAMERIHAGNLEPHVAALAVHFRQAGPLTDAEKAIDYSVRAGEAAADAFAYTEAITHWQAALERMEEREAAPERQAELLMGLGVLTYVSGVDYAKGIEYLERALRLYEDLNDSWHAAWAHWLLGRDLATFPDMADVSRALAHYRAAEPIFAAGQDELPLGHVNAGIAAAEWMAARPQESLAASRRSMQIGDRLGNGTIWAGAAITHGAALAFNHGRLAKGLELLRRAWALADELDEPSDAFFAAFIGGWCTLTFLLDSADAEAWFTRELARPRTAQARIPSRMLQEFMRTASVIAGNLAETAPGDEATPTSMSSSVAAFWQGNWEWQEALWTSGRNWGLRTGNRLSEGTFSHWLARFYRARGDLMEAEEMFKATLAVGAEGQFLAFEMLERPDLALLYVETRRLEEARAQVARCHEILARGEDWRGVAGRVALADAVLAAAEGDLEAAGPQLERALDIFRRYGLLWDQAEALHLRGRACAAAGRRYRPRALEAFDAAIDIYRRHGAGQRWIDRVERDRKHVVGTLHPPQYPSGLSEREVEVLRLIAEGKSGREIAEALVISVRTVERHIENIYHKTGTHGRAQATAYALANGLA